MAGERVQRRLAAILAADVAGYSRLMGSDEERTLAGLKACRELINLKSKEHRGRIVNTPGDSALVEFVSAVDARRKWRNVMLSFPRITGLSFASASTLATSSSMSRGIFMATASILPLESSRWKPGTLCLSDEAYRQIRGKLPIDVSDMGEHQLKNIV